MVTKKAERQVYKGKVVRVSEYDLDFGNGKASTFEIVTFSTVTGVSAIPVTENGVKLIKHYQAGLGVESFSLPTGGLNEGENPAERMQLELQEELGFRADKLKLMMRLSGMPGYIGTEPGYVFLASGLIKSRLEGDEHYSIKVYDFTWDEVLEMIKSGEIVDARTITAILYYDRFYR
jgi:ADP-ribose pyrophosphatase